MRFQWREDLKEGIAVEKLLEVGDHISFPEVVLSHIKVHRAYQMFAFLAPINLKQNTFISVNKVCTHGK